MREIKIDLSQLDNLNLAKLGKQIKFDYRPKPAQGLEKSLIKSSINSSYSAARQVFDLAEDQTYLTLIKPKKYSVGSTNAPSGLITIGVGVAAGHALIVGPFFGAGVYGSNTGEFGWYYGGGCQFQTNVSASAGIDISYIFGPPSTFNGASIGVGVAGGILGVWGSGMIIFSTSGQIIGVVISLGGGVSVLPLNFQVQLSYNNVRPIFVLK